VRLSEFLIAAVISEITPGPNMGYLAILAASRGRGVGLAAVAGVALGLMLNGLAAALGVAALIIASPAAFEALRWGGVAFLLYLAWDAWRTPTAAGDDGAQSLSSFARGLMTNLLNPKAAMFYVAVLPRFMDPSRTPLPQSLTLTALHVLVATIVHAGIVIFAAQSRRFFAEPALERRVRRALAALLALVALWFLWETAR
jgi:threonine/homoserine/homoserine lactone efflux protein